VDTWQVWLVGLGTIQALMLVVWLASVVREDTSLVDRVWGLAFVVGAWTYALLADGAGPRTVLVLVLVTIWGVRLSVYLTARNWGKGEDKRYQEMRARHPDTWTVRSLFTVFLLQGALAWFISLPLLGAVASATPEGLIWLDLVGAGLWLVGFVFEAGGDWQLSRFLADPDNRGKVMDQGLWRYTRHPNYFGDTAVWWAYGAISLAAGAWWGLAGSVAMTFFIVKVSGLALTEKNMSKGGSKREGYDEYVRRTNAFFPAPPKD
jgi:steroid 5-alpha reductase family enzyme